MSHIMQRIQDREIQANREGVLTTLRENREAHIAAHAAAVAAYPDAAVMAVREFRALIDDFPSPPLGETEGGAKALLREFTQLAEEWEPPSKPQNYAEQYDKMIMVLEAETRDTIVLTGREVATLLHDEWDWKRVFDHDALSVSRYAGV